MNRRGAIKKLAVTSLFAAMLPIAMVMGAPAASAAELGPMNLPGFCRSLGFDDVILVENSVAGWRCVNNTTGFKAEIDVNRVCEYTYPRQNSRAAYRNAGDPFSWYCYN